MARTRRIALGLALLGLIVSVTTSGHVHSDDSTSTSIDDCAVCAHVKSQAVAATTVAAVELSLFSDKVASPSPSDLTAGWAIRRCGRAPPGGEISPV